MSNAAPPLPTRELCDRAGVTRNVLTRLREQYPDRIASPLRVGAALAWPLEAVQQIRALIAEEDRVRGAR